MDPHVNEQAIGRIERQMSISEIEESFQGLEGHYVLHCARADTLQYTIRCSCGWWTDTGRAASTAYALMRAHVAGHNNKDRGDDLQR